MTSESDPKLLTNVQLAGAPADARVGLVEAYLLASIRALNPGSTAQVDTASRLADLSIDSLQIIELKFGLDQLLGQEVDIELVITNPSIGTLAATSVQAAGL
jgi:acyl carrier protein